jgi:hypothetical protein
MQSGMQHDLPAGRIMMQDQRLGVVEQDLARHATEGAERALHAIEPAVLLLMAIGAHMQATRVTQRGHEQKDFDRRATDRHPALAEIDLQLFARLRLKADRRTGRRNQLSPQRGNRTFHRAQADHDVLLPPQLLANHIRVARMLIQPLSHAA